MIYLRRLADTIEIEACEKPERVPLLQAQGYEIVTRAAYIPAWQARARLAFMALCPTQPKTKPRVRAVGGWEIGDFWKLQ